MELSTAHSTRHKGKIAEDIASRYLQEKGYRIVTQNLFTPYGEIDILAKQGEEYVCVEVRSRKNPGPPAFAPEVVLSRVKYTHLVRSLLSLAFLQNKPVRIDLITVEGRKVRHHYKNIEI